MRIAMASVFPPYRGGIAQFNEQLGLTLMAEGHDLLTVNYSRQYPRLLFPGTSQIDPTSPPKLHAKPMIDSIWPPSWDKCSRELIDWSPDLLIIPFWQAFLAPSLIGIARRTKKKLPSLRIVGLLHNAQSHEAKWFESRWNNRFLENIDEAWTLSRAVHASVSQRNDELPVKELFHPIYSHFPAGIDQNSAREALGLPLDVEVILFFGLIRPYKGLEDLILAFELLKKNQSNVHLLIAGECYESWSKYQGIIDKTGLSNHIHLHQSFIPEERVPLFFSASNVVCLPYRSASQSGVTALAMHYQKKTVVTKVGGLTEYFNRNPLGFLCNPAQPEELANTLSKALIPSEINQMEIDSWKEGFSWQSFVAKALDAS
ncbi:MAG: glycosyltransferase [Bacteroidetes bacterium]|nr:glycosyltransferase [Bacteroidota bacterium]MDA1335915.1 glycosyltransferase [Bacteroidota bacterium]